MFEGRGQILRRKEHEEIFQSHGNVLYLEINDSLFHTAAYICQDSLNCTIKVHVVYGMPNIPYWRRQWHPTPVLLPGKSHGQRSLVGCSPWSRQESDMTERLHFHFLLSCIGEGNGNPLQCSCSENPRDGGAWWAAIYGVAQSRTRLKRQQQLHFKPCTIRGTSSASRRM